MPQITKQTSFCETVKDQVQDQIKNQGKLALAFKIITTASLYIFIIVNSMHDLCNPGHVPECITDKMQDATLPITRFLGENPLYKNTLIIAASLMMDFTVVTLTYRWFVFERNYKLVLTCFIFYMFRGFLQSVFFMRFPSDYIWGHPGLFSMAVPYQPANDFFFSGHVGLSTIAYIYFKRTGRRFMAPFALLTLMMEFFTLLVTRAHYFIDLIIAIIIGHYITLCVDWLDDYFAKKELNNEKNGPIAHMNLVKDVKETTKLINANGNHKEEKPRKKVSC